MKKHQHSHTHTPGFTSTLKKREGPYFLPATIVALPNNVRLDISQTTEGVTAKIMPVTLTPAGMEALRNKNDLWTFSTRVYTW